VRVRIQQVQQTRDPTAKRKVRKGGREEGREGGRKFRKGEDLSQV
jgi:hypothetical protein